MPPLVTRRWYRVGDERRGREDQKDGAKHKFFGCRLESILKLDRADRREEINPILQKARSRFRRTLSDAAWLSSLRDKRLYTNRAENFVGRILPRFDFGLLITADDLFVYPQPFWQAHFGRGPLQLASLR